MKISLLISFFLLLQYIYGQDTVFIKHKPYLSEEQDKYITDTVVFSSSLTRNFLIGTTILPSTHNQMNARNYGLYFDKITKTECQESAEIVYQSKDKINSITGTDSTLTIDINIYDNCCYDFLCDISVDSTGILNLIYYGYGSYCFCDCCYGLTFHLVKETNYHNIKAVILNGDRTTLKKIRK